MDFQKEFIATAHKSPAEAAALVTDRIEEIRSQSREKLGILGAFTSVVEKDLQGIITVINSGGDTYVVPCGDQPSCVGKAVDCLLNDVMKAVANSGAPAAKL